MDILAGLGRPFTGRCTNLLSFGAFLYQTGKSAWRTRRRGSRVLVGITSFQIYFTCIQALPVIFFLALFLVVIVLFQADNFIGVTEGSVFLANIFSVIILRELAPLLTCLVVVGRSGTAIASELASMTVNEEVHALRVSGVDPLAYIVLPRFFGITISMVCLSLTFTLLSMIFTIVVGEIMLSFSPKTFVQSLAGIVSGGDVLLNITKSAVFGAAISLLCCFAGLSVRGMITEIPQAATRAVVSAVFWCFVFSAMATVLVY